MKKKTEILLLALMLMLAAGCGTKVNHKSPEAVAESLVNAYHEQDERAVKKCFGLDPGKDCKQEIQKEIDYNLTFFKAHDAVGIKIKEAKSLGTFDKKELVYVRYNYEIKGRKEKQEAPALGFYFLEKRGRKYYVVPAIDVTPDMSKISKKEFSEFSKTRIYKEYDKQYQNFIRKNPKYENELKNRFEELSN